MAATGLAHVVLQQPLDALEIKIHSVATPAVDLRARRDMRGAKQRKARRSLGSERAKEESEDKSENEDEESASMKGRYRIARGRVGDVGPMS